MAGYPWPQNAVIQKPDGSVAVEWADSELTDETLEKFARERLPELLVKIPKGRAIECMVNFSGNQLRAGEPLGHVLGLLRDAGVHITALRLHKNRFGDKAAFVMAQHMMEAAKLKKPLMQLHLSGNELSEAGIRELVVAATTCNAYPRQDATPLKSLGAPQQQNARALWLRIERQKHPPSDPEGFLRHLATEGFPVHWSQGNPPAEAKVQVHFSFCLDLPKGKADKGKGKGKGKGEDFMFKGAEGKGKADAKAAKGKGKDLDGERKGKGKGEGGGKGYEIKGKGGPALEQPTRKSEASKGAPATPRKEAAQPPKSAAASWLGGGQGQQEEEVSPWLARAAATAYQRVVKAEAAGALPTALRPNFEAGSQWQRLAHLGGRGLKTECSRRTFDVAGGLLLGDDLMELEESCTSTTSLSSACRRLGLQRLVKIADTTDAKECASALCAVYGELTNIRQGTQAAEWAQSAAAALLDFVFLSGVGLLIGGVPMGQAPSSSSSRAPAPEAAAVAAVSKPPGLLSPQKDDCHPDLDGLAAAFGLSFDGPPSNGAAVGEQAERHPDAAGLAGNLDGKNPYFQSKAAHRKQLG
eukprot:TRINITY_DN4604_c0_g1_i1.p1 TRINITY_DN4604_c0_g1~~TRINITY_DN4604_c0_g1_i1.p1  ORF type:complete len:584 (-),score=144.98 TRINITY_DN4604_c0_g1_i1:347-2098(-)